MEEDLMIGIDVDGDGIEKMEENNAAAAAAADDDDDDIGHQVDDLFTKVEKLEQRVNEIEQFYLTSSKMQSSTSQKSSFVKEKEKLKHIPGYKKHQQEAARREAIAAKRMQDIMRQFGSILRQITQHKWAWPFMQPVDVEGLGLRDYYENAMKYNDDKSDVHAMAKTLLEKFEEKWLQFLPRVTEEEKRREEEEAEAQLSIQRSQEAAHAKMARDLSNELYETDMRLEKLRETVVQKCRKMSTEDKRNIGIALTRLCPEDLSKALDIVARHNPSFQSTAAEIDLDIDAQSELTLWRLKYFVKDALHGQVKNDATFEVGNKADSPVNPIETIVSKRKMQICNALAKTAKKRNQKR